MSKIKLNQKSSAEKTASIIPAASLLQSKEDIAAVEESYKLKLLGDIAQLLWGVDNRVRTLVFNVSRHIENNEARFSLALVDQENWGSNEDFVLEFLATELNKGGYKLFVDKKVKETEILITWGWRLAY